MQNTSSLPCSDRTERTRPLVLFGHRLSCKGYLCARDGGPYTPKPEQLKLQLSILPTDFCPAACRFCIMGDTIRNRDRLDLGILEETLWALREAQVVRGISITGGEPFSDIPLLNRVIRLIFSVFGPHMEVSINTNGMNIHRLGEIDHLRDIDALHISRHHYDEGLNSHIFGLSMPGNETLKKALHSVSFRDLFVLNCMLLRDYIGTPEEAHRYMDFAIEMGAGKVSFITATPVNPYIRDQRVNFSHVLREEDPRLLFTREYRDYEFCRCRDGVYAAPSGGLMEFYGRETDAGACDYVRGLVYGSDNRLRAGFGGEVIRDAPAPAGTEQGELR